MQHPLIGSSNNAFRQRPIFGLPSIRLKQDGDFFESMPASVFGLLNSELDLELVVASTH
jgi:hypothetical protein